MQRDANWLLQYAVFPCCLPLVLWSTGALPAWFLKQKLQHSPASVCRLVQLWTLEASLSMPGGQE